MSGPWILDILPLQYHINVYAADQCCWSTGVFLTGPQKTRGFLWCVTISTWAPTAKGKTCHQTKRSSSGRRNVENTAGTEHTWRFCYKHKQKNCNTCSGCELGRPIRGHRAAREDDQFEEQPPHSLLSLQFRWIGGRCWVWFQLFLCILLTSLKEISKLSTFLEELVLSTRLPKIIYFQLAQKRA